MTVIRPPNNSNNPNNPVLSEFAKYPKSHKQANTLIRLLDLLNPLAVIKRVSIKHLMLGTFLVQISTEVNASPRQLDFFIPPSGGTVYRYDSAGNQTSIHLDRDSNAQLEAIASARASQWLPPRLALKMSQA